MPTVFQDQYSDTRVIIDGTEIEIHQLQSPDTQSETWSDYENRNTVKFLLGVTPNGVPSFGSHCFGGGILDKELTERSGLLDRTHCGEEGFFPGDAIMAD